MNSIRNVTVSPTMPVYFKYRFPVDRQEIFISVVSDDDTCALVSLQQLDCPAYEFESNEKNEGIRQSLTKKAFFNVDVSLKYIYTKLRRLTVIHLIVVDYFRLMNMMRKKIFLWLLMLNLLIRIVSRSKMDSINNRVHHVLYDHQANSCNEWNLHFRST